MAIAKHQLIDCGDNPNAQRPKLNIEFDGTSDILWVLPEGYGDATSEDGHGSPLGIEYYNGSLRLIVYKDINEQEPQIIDLEKARESNRKDT